MIEILTRCPRCWRPIVRRKDGTTPPCEDCDEPEGERPRASRGVCWTCGAPDVVRLPVPIGESEELLCGACVQDFDVEPAVGWSARDVVLVAAVLAAGFLAVTALAELCSR